jgi:hypothetical protein
MLCTIPPFNIANLSSCNQNSPGRTDEGLMASLITLVHENGGAEKLSGFHRNPK